VLSSLCHLCWQNKASLIENDLQGPSICDHLPTKHGQWPQINRCHRTRWPNGIKEDMRQISSGTGRPSLVAAQKTGRWTLISDFVVSHLTAFQRITYPHPVGSSVTKRRKQRTPWIRPVQFDKVSWEMAGIFPLFQQSHSTLFVSSK
jgi:hypothetical protein